MGKKGKGGERERERGGGNRSNDEINFIKIRFVVWFVDKWRING